MMKMAALLVCAIGYAALSAAILTNSPILAAIAIALAVAGLLLLAFDCLKEGDLVAWQTAKARVTGAREWIQDHVFPRTSCHILVWIVFGVVLAAVPFGIEAIFHHKPVGWLDVVPAPELILISVALCAGAFGELVLRTILGAELTLKIGTWAAYPLVLIVMLYGTYRYANISESGQDKTPTTLWWSFGIVVASLLVAGFTITVNERAELYARGREKRRLAAANKALAAANGQLVALGKSPVVPEKVE